MVTEREFKALPEGNLSKFIGLSTDDKPTTNVINGSEFFEMDTADSYFYDADNEVWVNPLASAVE